MLCMLSSSCTAGAWAAHCIGSAGPVPYSKGCQGARGRGDLLEERMQAGQHQKVAAPSHAECCQAVH